MYNRDRKRELWNDQIPKGSYRIHGGNWISGIMGISWVYHGYIMVYYGISWYIMGSMGISYMDISYMDNEYYILMAAKACSDATT